MTIKEFTAPSFPRRSTTNRSAPYGSLRCQYKAGVGSFVVPDKVPILEPFCQCRRLATYLEWHPQHPLPKASGGSRRPPSRNPFTGGTPVGTDMISVICGGSVPNQPRKEVVSLGYFTSQQCLSVGLKRADMPFHQSDATLGGSIRRMVTISGLLLHNITAPRGPESVQKTYQRAFTVRAICDSTIT